MYKYTTYLFLTFVKYKNPTLICRNYTLIIQSFQLRSNDEFRIYVEFLFKKTVAPVTVNLSIRFPFNCRTGSTQVSRCPRDLSCVQRPRSRSVGFRTSDELPSRFSFQPLSRPASRHEVSEPVPTSEPGYPSPWLVMHPASSVNPCAPLHFWRLYAIRISRSTITSATLAEACRLNFAGPLTSATLYTPCPLGPGIGSRPPELGFHHSPSPVLRPLGYEIQLLAFARSCS
jgi:hypothetical protein